jgi:transposase InsO family protein
VDGAREEFEMKVFYLFGRERGYNRAMLRIQEVGDHPQREEIVKRLKAIWLLERGRVEELKAVLGVSRSTAFSWKKRLRVGGNNVLALAPRSRAPQKRRQRSVDGQLVEYIRRYRVERPGTGKATIRKELERYCLERGLPGVSESSVGRVIADLKKRGRLPGPGLVHQVVVGKGHLHLRAEKRRKKKNRRNGYQPEHAGDLVQMDSLAVFQNGIRRYMLSAIDLNSRFGFAFCYPSLSSRNATDFLKKFLTVAPFPIRRIQTDNGCEFDKDFAIAIRDSPIQHFHTYPRHPQSNAYVERFNRTLRSQFIEYYEDDIEHTTLLNQRLVDYLLWYNIRKPHRGIANLSPMEYYMQSSRASTAKSKMCWTLTPAFSAAATMVQWAGERGPCRSDHSPDRPSAPVGSSPPGFRPAGSPTARRRGAAPDRRSCWPHWCWPPRWPWPKS